LWAGVVLAGFVALGVGGGLVGAIPAPRVAQSGLDSAYEEVAAADAALAEAELAVSSARGRLGEVQGRLDAVAAEQRLSLSDYEALVREARQIVTDAYIRGTSTDEIAMVFDAAEATRSAVRMALSTGRVDRAREVSASLRSLRAQYDDDVNALIEEVSAARQSLADAEAARVAAANRLEAARSAAAEAETAAANEAAAREAASRVAAAPPAASPDDEAPAGDGDGADGDGNGGGGEPPPPQPVYSGPTVSLDEAWAYLRDCESGGNYQVVDPSGTYFGAYQFDLSTWASVGGSGNPADASPAEQDYRAWLLYQQRGNAPWPYCGRYLP
jgi:hypothetical protein